MATPISTARPLVAPLPGMGLMGVQPVGIGLHDFTSFQKQQAEFVCGHACNKRFGLVEGRAEPRRDVFRVNGFDALQRAPLGSRIVGIPPDFGNQPLRREAG
jgi:hypothetical protein